MRYVSAVILSINTIFIGCYDNKSHSNDGNNYDSLSTVFENSKLDSIDTLAEKLRKRDSVIFQHLNDSTILSDSTNDVWLKLHKKLLEAETNVLKRELEKSQKEIERAQVELEKIDTIAIQDYQ